MNWYIITIADYPDAPEVLFCENTAGLARKNLAGTKVLVRCNCHVAGEGCLSWISGDEIPRTTEYIKIEMLEPEWLLEE